MDSLVHDLALRFLNSRDRTVSEIHKHLQAKGISEDSIGSCIEYLSECGLINDEDYCEKYILYGIEKGRGPIRLKKELEDRGIPSEIISNNLEIYFGGDGEREAGRRCLVKSLKKLGYEVSESAEQTADYGFTEKEIAKIGRRLASQGFHSHVIYELLGKLMTRVTL